MDKEIYSNKIIYKNSALSLGYKVLGIILSFVASPILLSCLGERKYGEWVTLLSFVSWIYYLDLGIGSGLRNNLTKSLARGDEKTGKQYVSTAYVLISGISAFAFVLASFLLWRFRIIDWIGLNDSEEDLSLCVIIAIGFACINFIISLVNNVWYALQKSGLVAFWGVLGQSVSLVAFIVISFLDVSLLVYFVIAEGFGQLLKNIIASIVCYSKNKAIKPSVTSFNSRYVKEIVSFGLQVFVMQIGALVLNSTDNIVISKVLNVENVTPYSFCYTYFGVINTAYIALITPLLSAYTAAYAKKDKTWIKGMMKKNADLYIIFIIGTIFAAFLFKPFSIIWLRKELAFDNLLIIFIALYYMLLMLCHVFSTFLTGVGIVRETTIATIIQTIINIPLSIFLAKNLNLGTAGVALGSALSLLVGITIGLPKTVSVLKKMKNNM